MTDLEMRKLEVDIAKVMSETAKLNKETFWYPMALATGLVLSIGAVMKFIL